MVQGYVKGMSISSQTMRNIASVRGDLSGSLLDPKVVGIQGIEITNSPSDGQTPVYNASSDTITWSTVSGEGGGGTGPQGPSGSQGPAGPSGSQGPQGEAGVSTNWTGEYNNGITYAVHDAVSYNGSSYVMYAFIGAAGYAPSAYPGNWMLLAQKGDQGEQGPQGEAGTPADLSAYATTASLSEYLTTASAENTYLAKTDLTASARSVVSAGTNISITDGQISLVASPTVTDLVVAGNLTVNGTTTSVNSTNLEIADKYILIASGAADAAALHGAGIQFGAVPSEDARIVYDATNDWMHVHPALSASTIYGAFTGSLFGTASHSLTAVTASALSGFNQVNPTFTAVTASYFTGSFIGDGSSLTSVPYDIAGESTGSIVSGSELMNYITPRAFTAQSFSQYTGSGAATAIVRKNGVALSYPASVSANDLITVVATASGSKAYFTVKGKL